MKLLEIFGAAAFGAILGAALAWIFDKRKVQTETAFDMHREYFDTLVEPREKAARFIRVHQDDGNLAEMWRSVDAAEMECVWKIVYFYERLSVALNHRYISRKLVPDLFGDAFYYWYKECFQEKLLPIKDPTARHIEDLWQLISKRASADEVAGWEEYRKAWQIDPRVAGKVGL